MSFIRVHCQRKSYLKFQTEGEKMSEVSNSSQPVFGHEAHKFPPNDLPQIVASIYQNAPATDRISILQLLLRPLSILSVFGIAEGAIGRALSNVGWVGFQVLAEDTQKLGSNEIASLVAFIEQYRVLTLVDLAVFLRQSPALSSSLLTAAALAIIASRTPLLKATTQGFN